MTRDIRPEQLLDGLLRLLSAAEWRAVSRAVELRAAMDRETTRQERLEAAQKHVGRYLAARTEAEAARRAARPIETFRQEEST